MFVCKPVCTYVYTDHLLLITKLVISRKWLEPKPLIEFFSVTLFEDQIGRNFVEVEAMLI